MSAALRRRLAAEPTSRRRVAGPLPRRVAGPLPRRVAGPLPRRVAGPLPRRVVDPARRGQRGATLLELLMVIAISGLLLGPLLAWTVLVLREQPVTSDGMIRTAQSGILQGYFPGDVLEAGAADVFQGAPTGQWGTWRQDCRTGGGRGGRPLAVLLTKGAELTKTIYSVAPMRDGNSVVPGKSSLWRSVCGANTGSLISATQVLEDVVAAVPADPAVPPVTRASCWSPTLANGQPDAACRQVRLQVQTADGARPTGRPLPRPTVMTASRRTDARSLDVDPTGNFVPIARPALVSQQRVGPGQVIVRFTSVGSTDSDGSIVSAQWELPTGPEESGAPPVRPAPGPLGEIEFTLSQTGFFTVNLTVTDDDGATNTSYTTFEIQNRSPVAQIAVTPTSATAGETTINMTAAGSSDPDGGPLSYNWLLTSALDAGEGLEGAFTGDVATWAVPPWAVGGVTVRLTVTDDTGATDITSRDVNVVDPLAPPPDPGPGPDPGPDPDPPVPGAPVADFAAAPGGGTSMSFDAGASTGSITSFDWDFGLLAGPTGSGASVVHTYPAPGTYTVTLTVTDGQGRTARSVRNVVVPGAPSAPTNVRVAGPDLIWDPRPGARRYLVELDSTGNGCARSLPSQAVAAGLAPRKPLPPNPCPAPSTARARVGVEAAAGGPVAYTDWINLPEGQVVK